MKFKIEDVVTCNSLGEGKSSICSGWILEHGEVFEVLSVSEDKVEVEMLRCRESGYTGNIYKFDSSYLKLDGKASKEDLERYMVYGTGCHNKSDLYATEKEMTKESRLLAQDSDWTGEIIGYKLTPIFRVEKKTVLSKFNPAKKKAKK